MLRFGGSQHAPQVWHKHTASMPRATRPLRTPPTPSHGRRRGGREEHAKGTLTMRRRRYINYEQCVLKRLLGVVPRGLPRAEVLIAIEGRRRRRWRLRSATNARASATPRLVARRPHATWLAQVCRILFRMGDLRARAPRRGANPLADWRPLSQRAVRLGCPRCLPGLYNVSPGGLEEQLRQQRSRDTATMRYLANCHSRTSGTLSVRTRSAYRNAQTAPERGPRYDYHGVSPEGPRIRCWFACRAFLPPMPSCLGQRTGERATPRHANRGDRAVTTLASGALDLWVSHAKRGPAIVSLHNPAARHSTSVDRAQLRACAPGFSPADGGTFSRSPRAWPLTEQR